LCQFWFSRLLIEWYLAHWLFLEQGGTWWQYGTQKWYAIRKSLRTTALHDIAELPEGARFDKCCQKSLFSIKFADFWEYFSMPKFWHFLKCHLPALTKESILHYLSNEYPNFREKIQLNIFTSAPDNMNLLHVQHIICLNMTRYIAWRIAVIIAVYFSVTTDLTACLF